MTSKLTDGMSIYLFQHLERANEHKKENKNYHHPATERKTTPNITVYLSSLFKKKKKTVQIICENKRNRDWRDGSWLISFVAEDLGSVLSTHMVANCNPVPEDMMPDVSLRHPALARCIYKQAGKPLTYIS